jgi:DNA-binding transcriptional LysR family regulator
MMKLDGVIAFVAVSEAGSITAAARRLDLSKSVVSERLAELERTLGARLLQRTTRKVAITDDGAAFLPRARAIVQEIEAAAAEIAERRGALSGPLRLAGPISFGSLHLGAALYGFLQAHPAIDLHLDLDDRFVDVAAGGYDAVVRHGPIHDNRLIAKRLAASRRLLVASPGYLQQAGRPGALADLEGHRAIIYSNRAGDWRFSTPGTSTVLRPARSLRVNHGLIMRDAAVAGLGVALLPTFLIQTELARGQLEVIDVGVEAEGAQLYIAYPMSRAPSSKVLALTAWLKTAFGDPPYWDREASPAAQPAPQPTLAAG